MSTRPTSAEWRANAQLLLLIMILLMSLRSFRVEQIQDADYNNALVAKFSSTRYGGASTRFNPGIVKEIALSSAARVFACSAVSSTSGGRTVAHAGSFA